MVVLGSDSDDRSCFDSGWCLVVLFHSISDVSNYLTVVRVESSSPV